MSPQKSRKSDLEESKNQYESSKEQEIGFRGIKEPV
jgi:hypothetical protein